MKVYVTGGVSCCMNISASIETYVLFAEAFGWTTGYNY
jgi:hypothetical protein